jgi:hypothetical protein
LYFVLLWGKHAWLLLLLLWGKRVWLLLLRLLLLLWGKRVWLLLQTHDDSQARSHLMV